MRPNKSKVDAKPSILGSEELRATAIFGFGFVDVTIDDGSVGSTQVSDATFKSGFLGSFRLGLGARYRIADHLVIEYSVIKSFGSYSEVEGVVSGSIDEDSEPDLDNTESLLELIYIF